MTRLTYRGLPQWLSSNESACSAGDAGDLGLITSKEDILEEEMATSLVFLPRKTPMNRGAWLATLHRVAKSQTQLSD